MKEYFLNLKEHFTMYFLHNVYSFKSAYSIRLYELLIQYYPRISSRYFSLDFLKDLLELKGRYKRFYDFRKRVIDVAVHEINLHSDIHIKYELKKSSRSVVGVNFMIHSNLNAKLNDNINNEEKVIISNTQSNEENIPKSVKIGRLDNRVYSRMINNNDKDLVDFIISKLEKKEGLENFTGSVLKALIEETYRLEYIKKSNEDLESKVLNENKKNIISEKYFNKSSEDDLYEYLFDNRKNSVSEIKNMIDQWNDEMKFIKDKKAFTIWLINKYGTEDEIKLFKVK